MGIPSYFSYIVKKHPDIIRKFNKGIFPVDNLYLDCNSIIYDAYYKMSKDIIINETISISIIKLVISKIEEYILLIQPKQSLIIAFDGVAPVAKLEQQRNRRYKSSYQNQLSYSILKKESPDPWNTAAITPGTNFMSELNELILNAFNEKTSNSFSISEIIVSGSNKPGEGEHKIFEYIRNNKEKHYNETTVIYGLDADLIMLSINHLSICPKIYLFRETPHFIQSIDSSLEPNSDYFLDIPELTTEIIKYMNNDREITFEKQKNKIYDYIFLCFFLGNDFLPHFPSLNIRTGGVDKMMNAYKATIGDSDKVLTDGNIIYWDNVRKLVSYLVKLEGEYIKTEHKSRDKKERIVMSDKTPQDKLKKIESIPLYEREIEKYINPFKLDWQTRYYRSLFGIKDSSDESNREHKKKIAINYLEGLEWTMKYYTSQCPDWRWKYKFNYPPLLEDLLLYIPVFETTFVPFKEKNPVSELVQLCYVLPHSSLHLIPVKLCNLLLKKYSHWYKGDCEFVWAYCRYFWEAHVEMNEIDICELEAFINDYKSTIIV